MFFFYIFLFFFFFFFFFFFQAEDGIRDLTVTGVQTCALPIWFDGATRISAWRCVAFHARLGSECFEIHADNAPNGVDSADRSEERRVGKECRSRWSP